MAEIDIAAVFQLLGSLATDMRDVKSELRDIKSQMATKTDIANMRQALTEYHASVLGHGLLITELDERLRKVERLVGILPPAPQ